MRILFLFFCLWAFNAGALEYSTALDLKMQAAGIPIEGVSVGKKSDRSTWRVDFKATATQAHRDQAAAIIAAFNPATDLVEPKTELQMAREEIAKLKAQMKEVAKTIPSVETVEAAAVEEAAKPKLQRK